jgi:hypothetical protein
MLPDLPDGTPNPNTHAFGHYSLEKHISELDIPEKEHGADLVVEVHQPKPILTPGQKWENRMKRKHARAQKLAGVIPSKTANTTQLQAAQDVSHPEDVGQAPSKGKVAKSTVHERFDLDIAVDGEPSSDEEEDEVSQEDDELSNDDREESDHEDKPEYNSEVESDDNDFDFDLDF